MSSFVRVSIVVGRFVCLCIVVGRFVRLCIVVRGLVRLCIVVRGLVCAHVTIAARRRTRRTAGAVTADPAATSCTRPFAARR
jgi:hypothetical protein